MARHLFIAGIPATGKTWVGNWLAEHHHYFHIDAEKNGGTDLDQAGVHEEWNELINTGRANTFTRSLDRIGKPVIINWGFPVRYLYVVRALQLENIPTWWIHGPREQAKRAYVARYHAGRGPHPSNFDPQLDDVEREWPLIKLVFGLHVISGLNPDGSQRSPEELVNEIGITEKSREELK